MLAKPYVISSLLISLLLSFPALAQSSGPNLDISASEIRLNGDQSTRAQTVTALTATVTDAASSEEAAELILQSLTPEQLAQTIVVSEDGEVLNHLAARYASTPAWNRQIPTPAFFPYGQLADNSQAYAKVQKSPLGRVWIQARDWGKEQRVSKALVTRYKYLTLPHRRLDAVYYTVTSGLRAFGWLYVKGNGVTAAHFNVTVATVSNLAFYQGISIAFSILPNRLSMFTNWTTQQIRKVTGTDRPENMADRIAGTFVSQVMINTTSAVLRALDPSNSFFTHANVELILMNSAVATSTSHYVQQTYGRLGQMQVEQGSDLAMTEFFLRRVSMFLGVSSMLWASTRELQEFNSRAWVVQGVNIGVWVLIHKNIDRISEFAENSTLLKLYSEFERGIFSRVSQAPGKAFNLLFRAESCLSLFGPGT